MRHIEARLREALEQRASEITHSERHAPDPSHVVTPSAARRDSRRPRLFVLVAAAVALVLAVASWIVIAGRQGVPASPPQTVTSGAPTPSSADSTDTPATPEPSVSATPTATPTSHVPGDYPRSAIPWSEVGPGWSFVGVVKSRDATSWTLDVVSPWGARYSAGTYEGSMIDVSGDGRRVLLLGDHYAVWVVDVATGTKHTIRGPDGGTSVWGAFTRPSGQAVLLLETNVGTPNLLRKIDVQTASTELSMSTDLSSAQSSRDGRYIVGRSQNPTTSVLILGNATGALVATVPTPVGATYCYPENWWSDDELVIRCDVGDYRSDLWRYSLSTHAMTRITRTTTAQFGYANAYPSSAGTVVQQTGSCGPGPIGILSRDGTTDTALKNLPIEGQPSTLITVVGTTAFLAVGSCGDPTDPPRLFVAYDLVTGTPVTLVPGTSSEGAVGATIVLT